jgi:hypothetical protein
MHSKGIDKDYGFFFIYFFLQEDLILVCGDVVLSPLHQKLKFHLNIFLFLFFHKYFMDSWKKLWLKI